MKTQYQIKVVEHSGCFTVGEREFSGHGYAADKAEAQAYALKMSRFAELMGCSPEQVEAARSKNRIQLQAMYERACKTGKLVNGYTSEQLRQILTEKF